MLEDLNTVHGLRKEIERLRAGEEKNHTPEMKLTAGQAWNRLLDSTPEKRIEQLRSLLESSDDGAKCRMEVHDVELNERYQRIIRLSTSLREWNTARSLISVFISALRKDQRGTMERGTVADKLELFLKGGSSPAAHAGRVLCGYRWTEFGRSFTCAGPVDSSGDHEGEHYAYVHEGDSADEELRMKLLEDENEELRRRLGLPPNRRRS